MLRLALLVPALTFLAHAPARTPASAGSHGLDDPAEEHARALADLEAGKFESAHRRFRQIAERWPDTSLGADAADRVAPNALLGWRDVLRHGPDENRVTVVLLQDGCELGELDSFDDLAQDVPSFFEQTLVFGEYFRYLNFVQGLVVSVEDGLDGHGREANTALGAHVVPRAVGDHVATDPDLVRPVLERMGASDGYAIVFVPRGLRGTGGPGLATVGGRSASTTLHEWGHAFAGLQDETVIDGGYRGPLTTGGTGINVSENGNPERVPWAHWIEAKARGIGVYEGAAGRLRGAFKPKASGCRMEDGESYCPVCHEALVRKLYEHVDPIEQASVRSTDGLDHESREFEVIVQRPARHALEVAWYVLPASVAPPESGDAGLRPRSLRGPLAPIDAKPARETRSKGGLHRFRLETARLEPGEYRVIVRVRDATELRGEKLPWVLKDELGLLSSERSWRVEVQR